MSFYKININTANNELLDLSQFQGKKVLIVNVASECGYTPQYAQLQELYSRFHDKLEILGVPCNDFGGQEPGSSQDVVAFCQKNYGVTFTITEKVNILGTPHPLYLWLKTRAKEDQMEEEVKWNFHKFLINEDGTLVGSYPSGVRPDGEEIMNWISE